MSEQSQESLERELTALKINVTLVFLGHSTTFLCNTFQNNNNNNCFSAASLFEQSRSKENNWKKEKAILD